MIRGMPGHNRKRPDKPVWQPKPCTNCTATPCVMFFWGGVRLCLECAKAFENETLSLDTVQANHDRRVAL